MHYHGRHLSLFFALAATTATPALAQEGAAPKNQISLGVGLIQGGNLLTLPHGSPRAHYRGPGGGRDWNHLGDPGPATVLLGVEARSAAPATSASRVR